MHSSSRRAFLRGRRLPQSPWEEFCQRLRRSVGGEFVEYKVDGAAGSGRVTVNETADVHHVRALCHEYGVVLCLEGLSMPVRQPTQPTVWVRPGTGMSQLSRIDDHSNRWFVQPGCTLGALVDAGFAHLTHLPRHLTVAVWLADRTLSDYPTGCTSQSGLEHVSLLLGDGESVHLGPFSTENTKPLQGLRLQQMVPALFRLAAGSSARACRRADFWPSRYRLDALMQESDGIKNLAQVCLGHGGDLGWIEWAVLNADAMQAISDQAGCFSSDRVAEQGLGEDAALLDWEIKALFDPQRVFPDYGQDL